MEKEFFDLEQRRFEKQQTLRIRNAKRLASIYRGEYNGKCNHWEGSL